MHCGRSTRLPLHDLQMHQNLAGALLDTRKLIPLEIHEAHVRRFHEALAHQRGRAKGDILTDTNRDIAAVAIHIRALPQATPDIANLHLELVAGIGVEVGFQLRF